MKKIFLSLYSMLLFLPLQAKAAWGIKELLGKGGEELETEDIIAVLNKAIEWLVALAAAICMIYIIIGGYHYLTSGGNEEKASTAKATLTWAIAGFIIAIGAFAILNYIQGFLPELK